MADGTPVPGIFQLEVVTPEQVVFSGPVTTVVAPAAYGYLGILANHAPLIATLAPGKITYRRADGTMGLHRSSAGGFLEVRQNHVTLLVDRLAA